VVQNSIDQPMIRNSMP